MLKVHQPPALGKRQRAITILPWSAPTAIYDGVVEPVIGFMSTSRLP
jgi:hypothetical protein